MKKYIKSSRLSEEFLKYHEEYNISQDVLDKVYNILDKYGTVNDPVDVVFDRATLEDQKKMLDLIRPSNKDGSHEMYHEAFTGNTKDTDYGQGILDMFNQLQSDGYIDERKWHLT